MNTALHRYWPAIGACCASLCVPSAWAGECELEAGIDRSTALGEAARHEATLRLACDVGWATQLEAEFAHTRSSDALERGVSLVAKKTLRKRAQGSFGWAIEAGLDAERRADGRWHRSEEHLELEASRLLGNAGLLRAKLGTARERDARQHSTTWELRGQYKWSDAIEWKLQLNGDDRTQRPLALIGLAYVVWPDTAKLKFSHEWLTTTGGERSTGIALEFTF